MFTKIKNFFHKIFGWYLIGGFSTLSLVGTTFAQGAGGAGGGYTSNAGFGVNEGMSDEVKGIASSGTNAGDSIISVIRTTINRALGLLSLIALIMLLWGGYKMVVSGGKEDAYQEGLKILKNAAIGIAFIAVSWLLVTFIFYVIGLVSGAGR